MRHVSPAVHTPHITVGASAPSAVAVAWAGETNRVCSTPACTPPIPPPPRFSPGYEQPSHLRVRPPLDATKGVALCCGRVESPRKAETDGESGCAPVPLLRHPVEPHLTAAHAKRTAKRQATRRCGQRVGSRARASRAGCGHGWHAPQEELASVVAPRAGERDVITAAATACGVSGSRDGHGRTESARPVFKNGSTARAAVPGGWTTTTTAGAPACWHWSGCGGGCAGGPR